MHPMSLSFSVRAVNNLLTGIYCKHNSESPIFLLHYSHGTMRDAKNQSQMRISNKIELSRAMKKCLPGYE